MCTRLPTRLPPEPPWLNCGTSQTRSSRKFLRWQPGCLIKVAQRNAQSQTMRRPSTFYQRYLSSTCAQEDSASLAASGILNWPYVKPAPRAPLVIPRYCIPALLNPNTQPQRPSTLHSLMRKELWYCLASHCMAEGHARPPAVCLIIFARSPKRFNPG